MKSMAPLLTKKKRKKEKNNDASRTQKDDCFLHYFLEYIDFHNKSSSLTRLSLVS